MVREPDIAAWLRDEDAGIKGSATPDRASTIHVGLRGSVI
jgi:hypothetical protein